MKKLKNILQNIPFVKILQRTVLALVGGGLIVLVATSSRKQSQSFCKDVKVKVDHSTGNFFIENEDVIRMALNNNVDTMYRTPISGIKTSYMEKVLAVNPYIRNAEVYIDASKTLTFSISQRLPILRVINKKGVSYYIDENGKKMPVSGKFTSRVPVATGNITDNGADYGKVEVPLMKDLYELSRFVRKDSFWHAEIEQVFVNEEKEIELIPKLGSHRILIGRVEDLEDKFGRLNIFYRKGLKNIGWYKYRLINLKYKDQIVCTKF